MALDSVELTVWDIGYRWAGFDPDRLWFRIPLPVRDNFRVLMYAILRGEIICTTLCLDKRPPDSKASPRYYVRSYLDKIYACIHGQRYDRELLRWAALDRRSFLEWCECRGITPPEFWFPPGWKMEFDHPMRMHPGFVVRHEEPEEEGSFHFSYHWPDADVEEEAEPQTAARALRHSQIAHIVCKQIASEIWRKYPDRSIADVIRDNLIQEYGGAKHYDEETVRSWINVLAPEEVRKRRGRPSKKKNTDRQPEGGGSET